MRTFLITSLLSVLSGCLFAQKAEIPPFLNDLQSKWVDSVFKSLSDEEKIAQILVIPAYSNKKGSYQDQLTERVKSFQIGGIISMQGGPVRHINMVNRLQGVSKTPLLVAIDGEFGLAMRLDSTLAYPYNMTLGALQNDSLIQVLGQDIGKQCRRLGIQVNFAPVADINSNPGNPVIGFRSYGDQPQRVLSKVVAFAKGLQSEQVLATLKHFPGHGDTQEDSHNQLPVVGFSRSHLDSIELYPFREAINMGVGGIMTGHLSVPDLDSCGVAATVSKPIVSDVLIQQLGFKGLVVTDAMNMGGVKSDKYPYLPETQAIMAGNDLVEFVLNPANVIADVKRAIAEGALQQSQIDEKCRKILAFKHWSGANDRTPISKNGVAEDLTKSIYRLNLRNAIQKSITVVQDSFSLLPLKRLDTLRIATVAIGKGGAVPFQQTLGRYARLARFSLPKDASDEMIRSLKVKLKGYNLVIVSVTGLGNFPSSKYRVTTSESKSLDMVVSNFRSIVAFFGNPYALQYFHGVEKADALVVGYQDGYDYQDLTAQALFGAFPVEGKIPVTVNSRIAVDQGKAIAGMGRFKYTLPEEVGIDSLELKKKVDQLITSAIDQKAFPGCEVFIACKGKVFFRQAYGHLTYSDENSLTGEEVYDLASLTKVLGPVPILMQLADQKKLLIKKKMSDYLPEWKGSNKSDLLLCDVLSHQARLRSGIPFWLKTIDKSGEFKPEYLSKDSTDKYPNQIAKGLFLIPGMRDTISQMIRKSPLLRRKKYVYSDLGFMLFPQMIEKITKQDFREYLEQEFYAPLGVSSLGYLPFKRLPMEMIAPTEFDANFRKEQIHGFVHDEGAALMGGVSGNAGLFGTAEDVAKVMQMYLNGGVYGDRRFLTEATVKDWTSYHYASSMNRRGFGFDKPSLHNVPLDDERMGYPAKMMSKQCFGHTGFTGTAAWADPTSGLLFVFLSNRIYPTRKNNLINHMDLRESLLELVAEQLPSAGRCTNRK